MCGFTITKGKPSVLLTHRGTEHSKLESGDWEINFSSLPLSSNTFILKQPLEFRNEKMVFNGEIFNYKQLDPAAESDLDYLYRLFDSVERNIFKFFSESVKWEGFWAIAVIDEYDNITFFTDPLGKKQIYHSPMGIASEIQPLVTPETKKITYDSSDFGKQYTPFGDIRRAIPGYLYKHNQNQLYATRRSVNRYFRQESPLNLYDLIDWNVKIRMENRIDNPAIFLSGGLDSNIVLHHMLKYVDKNDIEIISIDNREKENVLKIQELYGVDINFISDYISEEDKMDAIEKYEHPLDLGSLYPNYMLFKELKNSMVLTGDGADELFSGYKRAQGKDTFDYDVFKELPYYHNIRLDRMSMAFTKEARSPLMANSLVTRASNISWEKRKGKNVLRELYKGILPDFITQGEKIPLRYKGIKTDEAAVKFHS